MSRETAIQLNNNSMQWFTPRFNADSYEGTNYYRNVRTQYNNDAVPDYAGDISDSLQNENENYLILWGANPKSYVGLKEADFNYALKFDASSLSEESSADLIRERIISSYKRSILEKLNFEPVEDGESHPVDEILEAIFKEEGEFSWNFIHSLFIQTYISTPAVCADFLHCISRVIDELDKKVLINNGFISLMTLIVSALTSSTPRLREAGLRLIDANDSPITIDLLREFLKVEKEFWLRKYANRILTNLTEM